MRTIDPRGRLYRHVTKKAGCHAYLRLPVMPSLFLAGIFHRPGGCPHWHYQLKLGTRP